MDSRTTSIVLIEHVHSFCRKRPEVGLSTLVNAVWAIVIWQYTGLEDVRFVTAALWKQDADLKHYVCAAHVDGNVGLSDLMQQIQHGTKELASDQLPLVPSRTEDANVSLLQSLTTLTTNKNYLETDQTRPFVASAPVELVAVPSTSGGLEVVVRFSPIAIDREQADLLVAAFAHIIAAVTHVGRWEDTLGSLDLVSDYDKAKLWAWNSALLPETVEACVHTLFRQRTQEEPEMIAVDAWDGHFTYAELDDISDRIAAWLGRDEGILPESIVPLCFEKSCWAIAALMGVIKAGGAIVFIDPAQPASRRGEILAQIQGQFVLTSRTQSEAWGKEVGVRTAIVDEQFVASLTVNDVYEIPPQSGVTPANLLYLIFTSGSTGKPKGCLIPHQAFVSGALQHATKSNLSRGSRILQLASYSFDVSMLEILTALMSGASVCTPDMSTIATQGLHPIFERFAITWAFLTPSLVKLLRPEMVVPTLKTLALGGEPLHKVDIETWAPHLQLINGYGPSECSVAAAGDPHLKPTSDPSNIGRSVGGLCWIVNAENHDRLVPLGAVGELLISGPILARGYLNDAEKTAASFIENPSWTSDSWSLTTTSFTTTGLVSNGNNNQKPMRFYKTGDLARFNIDGTIQILGRKDTQVKLRGLRVELGEIEHNIALHPYVKHATAFLPKSGLCKEKIVTVLCLNDFSSESKPGDPDALIEVLLEDEWPAIKQQADAVRSHLRDCVPEYMVPTVWIVIKAWPLLLSAKLDRKRVLNWLLNIDQGLHNNIMGFLGHEEDGNEAESNPVSEAERTLRDVFSRALKTSAHNLPLDKSFIALGGDSLAAMRVVSECKRAGYAIDIRDLLTSKGITELAGRVEHSKQSETSFPLSMAQQLCLGCFYSGDEDEEDKMQANHCTQSLLLRLDNAVSTAQVKAALGTIVNRHAMLRARFFEANDGTVMTYRQTTSPLTEGLYRYKDHLIEHSEQIEGIAATARRAVELSGPVFSADLISGSGKQLLLLMAHNAVVDSTSWSIIVQDLQMCLSLADGPLPDSETPRPVSFQTWVELERETYEKGTSADHTGILTPLGPKLDYWDMQESAGDMVEQTLEVDKATAALLLGTKIHKACRTDAVDFLIVSLLLTFNYSITDRETLPSLSLWEDERGPASRDLGIDLATTIGQFETVRPLVLNTDDMRTKDELVGILKSVKDARRLVGAGRSDTSRRSSDISLRYRDLSNVLDSPNDLLQSEPRPSFLPLAVENLRQTSLISIMAEAIDGRIQLAFSYNKHIKDSDQISALIAAVPKTLMSLVARMVDAPKEFTLSDFTLLPELTYSGLEKLINEQLPRSGLDPLLIEDMYPCSPMQQDLLLSQTRSSDGMYECYHIAELRPRDSKISVDIDRLLEAWVQVVQRHASLRTIFIESTDGQEALFNQVVLTHVRPSVSIVDCDNNSTDEIGMVLANQAPIAISFRGPQPPHRMTVCRISGANRVVIKLDINHAIVDGVSAAVMLRDMLLAYDGLEFTESALPFRNYIAHICQTSLASSISFWVENLNGAKPTLLPKIAALENPNDEDRQLNVVSVPLEDEDCVGLSSPGICRIPDEVCFGYLSAGRDAPLPGIQDAVGAYLTMLVSRLRFAVDGNKATNCAATLLDAVHITADDYVKALPHQHVGLSNIQHALKIGGDTLFNTIVTVNREAETPADSTLLFKNIGDHEPDEYAVVVDIQFTGLSAVRASLRHWTDHLTPVQAQSIASAFGGAVQAIVSHPNTLISEVDLVGVGHMDKFLSFNAHPLPRANRLIFTRFEELALTQPLAQAVCAWDGEWSYVQLDKLSTRLAHYLRSLGVGPEVVVPHCFQKSGWAIVTCMAILKAGGAFVGLDPTHPRQRLQGLVRETGAKVVCLAPQNSHLFEERESGDLKLSIVEVTLEFVAGLPFKPGRPCTSIKPNNAACVVFTSGTTGRPKAVVVEHASMATLSDLMGPAVRIGPEARVFQFASYTFDTSNQDIFTTLQRGGCVCVPSEEDRVDDPAGAINRLGANHAHLTSTVISLLHPEQVPHLKWLFSAGESLTRENVEVWAPAVELFNSYGPAEASVAVTCTPTRLDAHASPANIGKSFGCWAWIVDVTNHHKLVPLGAVGELLIEGPLLARHYLNNESQTNAAFIENPMWAKSMTQEPYSNRRFYRTGDLCRVNTDGSLTIIGRRDTQIKIHGQRVELDQIKYEVQEQLAQLGEPSLVSVDALMLPQITKKDKILVAFVQFLNHSSDLPLPSTDELAIPMSDNLSGVFVDLQRSLKTSLPKYMVPAMFVPITETPLTANGKLARNILCETVTGFSDADVARYMLQDDSPKTAARTPHEQLLQAVWSKVLSIPIEKVGVNDDFFQLGGDSVVAMRLAAAARMEGLSLAVADIFASPILSDMARVARTADGADSRQMEEEETFDLLPLSSPSPSTSEGMGTIRTEAAAQCGVNPETVVDLYPCTPLQEGLIALSMRQTGAYKDQRILRLTDPNYSVARFHRAVDAVVSAEPILRTRFVSTAAAGMLQAVLNAKVEWVERDDLTAYLKEDLDKAVTYGSPLVQLALIDEHRQDGERYIVWSGHHAMCDGFSMDITFEQIAYAMAHEGAVMPKPVPFKNFIRFLQNQISDDSATKFWQEQFPANKDIPSKFPPVPLGHQVVPHRACQSQLHVARPSGSKISVTNYLRAAWGLVVARHLDSSDVIFGATLSGRNAPVQNISTINGPTMTTVPFRMTVPLDDGETTIAQYLEAVEEQAVTMTPFEHTGLQNIQHINEHSRAAINNMVHRFAVELKPSDAIEAFDGIEIVSADLPNGFYTDPLVIRNYAHDDGLTIDVEAKYDYTLISCDEMRRLLDQYAHVVQQLINSPEKRLRDIQFISPKDIEEIIKWNGELPETVQECVHSLIAEQTTKRPEAEAICAWDGSYTFGELNSLTERLAAHLQGLGVGPEVTIALCFDKSKWNVVSMLSILKTGASYTALNPEYPAARLQSIIQDVQTPIVLCSPQHVNKFASMEPLIMRINDDFLESLPEPKVTVTSAVQPSNAAFIVLTSGSTGKPKGAVVEHRGIVSMQYYEGPHVGMGPDTRTLQFAAHVFDVSNSEVFTTLMRGGCVCIPSETERMNDLAGAINKYNVNWSFQVPTTADTLDPSQVPGLRYLVLGGEAISQGLCDRWAPEVTLLNSYGPSECSIWTSASHLAPGTSSPNNIGRGLGCRTWITDKNDHNSLVPIGCVGELCVEGPIVTRGYKANLKQTAAAYIQNPAFALELGILGMRIYKTGDLVKYDSDGTLLYVGRKDSQVKVRGQRIELSEVEQNIVANGIQTDAVVVEKILQGGDADRVALVAFCILNSTDRPSSISSDSGYTSVETNEEEEKTPQDDLEPMRDQLVVLRRNLLDTIPTHMVPSFFIPLRSMPVTQTGKKDRKALRELGASLSQQQLQRYALDDDDDDDTDKLGRACTSDAERRLRSLWAEVLGIAKEESISAQDNFFLKGGDSIQAMRLAAAARRQGKMLAVADMFRMPRLFQMAELWEHGNNLEGAAIPPFSLLKPNTIGDVLHEAARQCKVEKTQVQDVYLCSPLQEGLMAVSTRKPGSYISTRIFDLPPTIDIGRFQAAWQTAADRFPILRTRVILGPASESLQVVLKEKLVWETIDGQIETILSQRGLASIEYGGRLCAFAIDVQARKFILVLHHALYDGWSATVLLEAVEKIYQGEPCPTGPSFNTFIHHLSQVDRPSSEDFWRTQLSGAPAHFPRLPNKTYEPKNSANVSHVVTIEEQPSGILKSTILKAAWAIVSARHAESNDISFGAAQSGRDCAVPGIEQIIGPIVTTVPVRVRIDDNEPIVSFLERIQDQSIAMIAYQHAGVQALRQQLGKEVQPALEFTSLFEFGEDSNDQSDFITEVQRPELLDGFWSYTIVLECHLAADGVTVNILARHDPVVIPTYQMDWVCKQFGHIVGQLCSLTSSSTQVVGDLEIFGPYDGAAIDFWNARWPCGDTDGKTVHEAIAEQGRLNPDNLALSGWDGDMTYAELEHYATKLAKRLVRSGVGPEVMVPLCFDKSKWAIVASLAVIKAGGEILKAAEAEFVLVSPQHVSLFHGAAVWVMPIDRESLDRMADFNYQLPKVEPSNAVYVCFTSGSTGKPKGIVVEHRNMRMSAQAHGAQFKINPGTRLFNFSAYTFDISLGDIFISLQRGATICTPSEWERLNELAGAITKYKANFMSVTPSVAKLLTPELVPTLRTLVLGGEAPTQDNIKTWSDKLDLILIWGPAETTIYASATPPTTQNTSAQELGNPMGSVMWLCDPNDHNKLVPLGCVGEIVVEGPLVSRGYLKDEEKTAAAYIQDPAWIGEKDENDNTKPRNMYKTGDLGRYNADGYILFSGRKDNQVKLHGQRMELDEVEHTMLAHETVRQAVARIPRNGPLKDKLVAMLSLNLVEFLQKSSPIANQIVVLDKFNTYDTNIGKELGAVRRLLEDNLPGYMVPSIWICVEAVPLNNNSKVDRKLIDSWLQEVDQATYDTLLRKEAESKGDEEIHRPSTAVEQILSDLISQILGLDSDSLNLNRSFLNLGGDSVSAMQLRSKSRAKGVEASMSNIIKSKSIVELASKSVYTKPTPEEVLGGSFALSPIQKMYVDLVSSSADADISHFDQSILLQVNSPVSAGALQKSLAQIVQRHSMLRARYSRDESGEWYQYLAEDKDTTETFHFSSEEVEDGYEVSRILRSFGCFFDIQKGPVFSAHVFNLRLERTQLLFVRAHHLVVDVVSWHILLGDLELLIATGSFATPPPLSFQSWLSMQKEMAESTEPTDLLLFDAINIPAADFEYWGMAGEDNYNTYSDAILTEFYLDEAMTAQLMGTGNVAQSAAPVDVILAALIHSFSLVFSDRAAPTIFSEGHGRESWNGKVNPSSTVGWFTTMSPLHVPDTQSCDILTTVQSVKDLRRLLPANGMEYFSSRYLSAKGREAFGSHSDMEIMFNYLGRSSEVGKENALLSPATLPDGATFDKLVQDEKLPRWSLFDIVALIAGGKAHITIAYNKNMQHQDRIIQWATMAKSTLIHTIKALRDIENHPISPRLSPPAMEKQVLFEDEVEGIYPCAPVQQHMLSAREKYPDRQLYEMEFAYKAVTLNGATVNIDKLREAWKQVVRHHAALRTVFRSTSSGSYEQIVLRDWPVDVPVIECINEEEMMARMNSHISVNYSLSSKKPHIQLTLFVTTKNNKQIIAFKTETDHTLTDGVSVALVLRDLALAYEGRLSTDPAPSFSRYALWLRDMSQEETLAKDIAYWKDFDRSAGASCIPHTPPSSSLSQPRIHKVKTINLDQITTSRLPEFCATHGVTMAAFLQTAWGLVLRNLTGSDKTLFAFMTANRDAKVADAGEIVGPLINMLLCRIDFSNLGEDGIGEVLRRARDDFLESLDHQYGLAKMEDIWQNPSWNSLMSLQYLDSRVSQTETDPTSISFDLLSARDPTAWDVSIGLQISHNRVEGITTVHAELGYWSDVLTDSRAGDVNALFKASVQKLLDGHS
ncbi:hypothetical protein BGW36DRAFT_429095 [Talaromyces proteolyticus]|uniref:Carrier domain-containing protein n=1 Tax=Talaromyces proteolyticus TaxID=1131652 RepID=A0AAD4KP91_9EURO|nr:uncharacterized protein BGW36DRAFT_429095 [Talaromyces proteolyticus]KAH8695213.1 hypothetical protein BGW36DRAFT_429095 [Talaromyces proteolyticus]